MSPTRADPDLDSLIWEITVDCHDEEEQLVGFENAFERQTSRAPAPSSVRTSRFYRSAQRTIAAS